MFVAALFTIDRRWKQPNCSSMDEWIKKMWYIYTMEYYSTIEKNKMVPFTVTWRTYYHIEQKSHTEKDKYVISLTGGILFTK